MVTLDGEVAGMSIERLGRIDPVMRAYVEKRGYAELAHQVAGHDATLIFPSPNRGQKGDVRPMSDMVFKALMDRMKVAGVTTHGFRSTFRDWCSESAHAV